MKCKICAAEAPFAFGGTVLGQRQQIAGEQGIQQFLFVGDA